MLCPHCEEPTRIVGSGLRRCNGPAKRTKSGSRGCGNVTSR